ncbi:hypothetical protein GCM10011415_13260 [Salipiger pallidus]|uniref:Flagellar FliJ protein n=1 Tax=Salipiger pallidus TaxID=1775170 RepID=A0A8J2ZIQ7_9RHOB|nr:flagellar FliJ family protein [Salipiger pallidus]GGG67563.1 hypothetical protein GCM10011415_13260 [Salipiger pallidus]
MATDRLRALRVMERLREIDTRERATEAASLRARSDTLETEREALLARLSGESRIEGLEGAPYLGRFITSIRSELDRNTREAARLAPELAQAEDRLREAMAEQKTYEILRIATLDRQRKEAARREARDQDMQTILRWQR